MFALRSPYVNVDELQLDLLRDKRSPTSRFLCGQLVNNGHRTAVLCDLHTLEVTSDPWLPDNMLQAVMPNVPLGTQLGITYFYMPLFGCCQIEALHPGSPAVLHLTRFRPIGKALLLINETSVHTVKEVSGCFRFHLERKHSLDSLTLLPVSMGVGENGPDKVDLAPHDHGQLRSVFGIDRSGPPFFLPHPIGPPPNSIYLWYF